MSTPLTPREIVLELDRFIIGQEKAKKAVAIALRNRWRRQQVPSPMREEILPKNILMIGPTGVGKTEIARRLAKLAGAPFTKVEATKFTEVGYVGRDVEQIIRDLLDTAILKTREQATHNIQKSAQTNTETRILEALVGKNATAETKNKFKTLLDQGKMEEKDIELEMLEHPSTTMPTMDVPGMPGAQMGMMNLGDLFGKAFGAKTVQKKLTVAQARVLLLAEESDKLLDQDKIIRDAITAVEQTGIVFLDEIDKICARSGRQESGSISREGVQRDLLPLLEGTIVSTKHGPVNTDHILFIASGAFHLAKPSDLLPELQGRLPNRVEMDSLKEQDFVRILQEPETSLIKQYTALLATENAALTFTPDGIAEIAKIAASLNESVENIGARRLHTVLERLLEEVSFHASETPSSALIIDAAYVQKSLTNFVQNLDLSKFIL